MDLKFQWQVRNILNFPTSNEIRRQDTLKSSLVRIIFNNSSSKVLRCFGAKNAQKQRIDCQWKQCLLIDCFEKIHFGRFSRQNARKENMSSQRILFTRWKVQSDAFSTTKTFAFFWREKRPKSNISKKPNKNLFSQRGSSLILDVFRANLPKVLRVDCLM